MANLSKHGPRSVSPITSRISSSTEALDTFCLRILPEKTRVRHTGKAMPAVRKPMSASESQKCCNGTPAQSSL